MSKRKNSFFSQGLYKLLSTQILIKRSGGLHPRHTTDYFLQSHLYRVAGYGDKDVKEGVGSEDAPCVLVC